MTEGQRKKGIPKWVWFGCGGGCLVLVLLVGAITFLGARAWQEGRDSEKQWPRLAEILPFDERPEHLELQFGSSLMVDTFMLEDHRNNLRVQVMRFDRGEDLDPMFQEEPKVGLFGLGTPVNPRLTELDVQGRTVRALSFDRVKPDEFPGCYLDLTGDDGRPVMVQVISQDPERPVDQEVVDDLLEPFDVWR